MNKRMKLCCICVCLAEQRQKKLGWAKGGGRRHHSVCAVTSHLHTVDVFYFLSVPAGWTPLPYSLKWHLLLLHLLLLDLLENDDRWRSEGHGLAPNIGLAAILVEIPIFNRHGLLAPNNGSNGHKERKHGCRREHSLGECVHISTRSWSVSTKNMSMTFRTKEKKQANP